MSGCVRRDPTTAPRVGCGCAACFRDAIGAKAYDRDPHGLAKLRAALAEGLEAIDARLRELDGRATAGHPSLIVNVAGVAGVTVPRVESEPR